MKRVCEENDTAVAHINNLNKQYEDAQAKVSDIKSDQIKLQSHIDDLTSDLVISRESATKIKTNWNTKIIVKSHLENM